MEKLVEDRIAKSIGLSNFSLRQVDEILKVARIHPLHNQVELSPYIPQVCVNVAGCVLVCMWVGEWVGGCSRLFCLILDVKLFLKTDQSSAVLCISAHFVLISATPDSLINYATPLSGLQWTLVEECKKRGVQCTAYCPLGECTESLIFLLLSLIRKNNLF